MIRLDKILVATDFSQFSEQALNYGAAIAARFDAELHLLHVVPDPAMLIPESHAFTVEAMQAQSEALVQDAKQRMESLPGGGWEGTKPVVREVRTGTVFLGVIEYAKQHDVDLLVIGTHGRSGLMHVLMGSVAEKLVRKSPCPVLTVKAEGHQFVMP